jgi:hypothetical protein
MLEQKTAGNLTDDEKRLLDTILYDLRMRYVQAAAQVIGRISGSKVSSLAVRRKRLPGRVTTRNAQLPTLEPNVQTSIHDQVARRRRSSIAGRTSAASPGSGMGVIRPCSTVCPWLVDGGTMFTRPGSATPERFRSALAIS